MSKPTNKPGWTATTNPSSEPTAKKLTGWSAGEKPSAEHMNWLFKTISEWINHVDVDQVKGETGDQGPAGEKGPVGDQGPAGGGSLSAENEARIAALESKANVSIPVSVEMPLSFQGSAISSEYNAGNSGSSKVIDWSNGVSQAVIVDSNTSISFSNPVPNKVYLLRLIQTDALAKSISWLNTISWDQSVYWENKLPEIVAVSGASVIIKKRANDFIGWGLNGEGGTSSQKTIPSKITYSIDFASIDGFKHYMSTNGSNSTLALDSEGYAYGWGRNLYGELGVGDTVARSIPTPVLGNRKYSQISAGLQGNTSNSSSYYTLAIEKDTGILYSWGSGDNFTGCLGRTGSTSTPAIATAGITYKKIYAGARPLGISSNNSIYVWGGGSSTPTLVSNSKTYVDVVATNTLNTPTDVGLFAMDSDGVIYSWQPSGTNNSSGILGNGTTNSQTTLTAISGNRYYSKMSCGHNHAAAIEAGTNKLYLWGNNQYGQIGDGTTTNSLSPKLIAGDKQFSNVVCGHLFTIAVEKDTNNIYVWGYGADYRLGTGSTDNVSVPTLLIGEKETSKLISLHYNGSSYVGDVVSGFSIPQSGSETKSGYIAGGVSLSNSMSDVQKLNFNSEILSTVQSYFGSVLDANGVYGNTRLNFGYFGQGTQSATHGYRSFGLYIATTGILPTVDNQNSSVTTKLTFANDTGSLINIRPTNVSPNNGWHTAASAGRKAVIQSSNHSYMHQASNALAKMTFASDTFSNVTTTNFAVSPTNYSSFGLSTDTIGTIWGSASSSITGYKISFANETGAVSTAAYTNSNITASGAGGEAIDGETKGYWQKQTAVSAASCYGCNKSTEMWNTIANALNYGATATATQGLAAGYFCGGDNLTGTPVYFRSATSQVKKVAFSPETYQVSSATLTNAKHLAAGFEG